MENQGPSGRGISPGAPLLSYIKRNTEYSAEFDPAPNFAYKGKIAHFP